MYVIREVVNCKPGKVREMVNGFEVISNALEDLGQGPMRLLTDVSGEPFWTVVAEMEVEQIEDFFTFQGKVMEDEGVREAMGSYHDLVQSGRREVYRVER